MSTLLRDRDREGFRVVNPSTGAPLPSVHADTPNELVRKVSLARTALIDWSMLEPAVRAKHLKGAIARIAENEEHLSRAIAEETGKPIRQARREINKIVATFSADLESICTALASHTFDTESRRSEIAYKAHGIVAVITPWNYPILMPHRLILPAIIAGNVVLFKPSQLSPLCSARYAEFLAAGLPANVLTVVQGGSVQGRQMVDEAQLVAFVGSQATGRNILERGAGSMTRVILELGGRDPMLVLADADLEAAAAFAVENAFRNTGQACTCTRRIYACHAVAKYLEEAIVAQTRRLYVGDALEESVEIGPMVSRNARSLVLAQIRQAVASGAQILTGEELENNFLRPFVLREPEEGRRLKDEEIFGPAVFVSPVKDEDAAIQCANRTSFGLGATIFTGDPNHGTHIARRLASGMVGINGPCVGVRGTPWIGVKESGYGFHGSPDGHRQFAQPQVLTFDLKV